MTPFQKISKNLVKAKIFRNNAVLHYNISDYNWQTGEAVTIQLDRPIQCFPPEQVDAQLIDGKNYLAGDQLLRIPFLVVRETRIDLPDDPQIIVNGRRKNLTEMRPFNVTTGGIVPGTDTITFAGITYDIGNIRGEQFMANEPADYYFTLRGGANEVQPE